MRSLSASERMMFSPWVPSRRVVSYRTTGRSGGEVGAWRLVGHGRLAVTVGRIRRSGRPPSPAPPVESRSGPPRLGHLRPPPTGTWPSPAGAMRSGVRKPSSRAPRTAASIASATSVRPSDQRQSIAAERIVPDRVRQVLAGDVGRRAVDRLVQAERAVGGPALPERRRGQHARAIRRGPPPRPTGCRRTGSRSRSRRTPTAGVTRSIAVESTSRCSSSTSGKSARTSSVTLRQRRLEASTLALSTWVTLLAARRGRASNASRTIALDLRVRVPEGVHGDAALRRHPLLGRAPEVDPAGELADDEHVHAGQQLRPERRGRHERRVDGDRPQVRVQPEPAAQREQGLLRADPGVRVVPARTADRAEEDRVGRPAALHVLGQDRQPVGVDRRAAGEHVRPVEPEPEGLAAPRPGRPGRDRRPPARRRRPGWRRAGRADGRAVSAPMSAAVVRPSVTGPPRSSCAPRTPS